MFFGLAENERFVKGDATARSLGIRLIFEGPPASVVYLSFIFVSARVKFTV